MKAVRLYEIGKFENVEVVLPELKNDEILVKVGACGICGSDIPRIYELGTRVFPVTLGHEFSGIVEAVANEGDSDLIGRKAAIFPLIPCRKCEMCETGNFAQCKNYNYLGSRSDGGFAEYCIIPSRYHLVLSSNNEVSLEDLSLVEPATVAQHAIRRSGLRGGEKILILGAGPIGILAARWAELYGAGKVVLFDILKEKIDFAMARNLEIYNTNEVQMDEVIKNLTNGMGFDVVIEGTGTSSGLNTAIMAVKTFGRITLLGNPHQETKINLNEHSSILRKEVNLVGVWNSYYNDFPFNEWKITVDSIDTGKLLVSDLITHKCSLESLPKLTRKIYNREVVICKAIYSADAK